MYVYFMVQRRQDIEEFVRHIVAEAEAAEAAGKPERMASFVPLEHDDFKWSRSANKGPPPLAP